MVVFFLLLVILAMVLGILGVVVKGLLYLLFTGIGVLLIAFILGALWMRRRSARRARVR
jgi:TM2 domain-containing membrane protein YozV